MRRWINPTKSPFASRKDYTDFGRVSAKEFFLHFLHTLILCTVIALLITLFTSTAYLAFNFVISYIIGLSIFLIATSLHAMLKPRQVLHSAFIFLFALCVGVLLGIQTGPWILRSLPATGMIWPNHYPQFITICLIAGSVGTYFFYSLTRIRAGQEMIEEERIIRIAKEKEALEAKLKLLQAQIEPHFLFNTLSNILSLIDTQPAKGKAMLLDLTKYLRTSLSRTFPEKNSLGQEIEMIKAYLNIQKIRMDERLHFKIDVPETFRQQSFPPMLLQPLVENAVKHGLEPTVEGGEIRISASEENGFIRIEVADTGPGFSDFNPSGVGIANVRERLAMLYGDDGRLIIEENIPHGVRVFIEVPLHDL
ncbi:MAG: histidine kinase [Deltaproteobacteria bacterium]|nr:histidine kinase [Deltaproteobacteria bacterium]